MVRALRAVSDFELTPYLKSIVFAVLEDYSYSSQLWTARAQAVHQAGPVHVA